MGVWGSVFGLSLALGPVLGGVLVSGIGWRAIFWINVPVGLTAIVLTGIFVPESKAQRARRLDPLGQALVIVALAFSHLRHHRRSSTRVAFALDVGLFVLSAVTFVVLARVELRRDEPLIDPRFFRSVPFSGASLIALAAFGSLGGFLFLNTLYLQDVRHYSALDAGTLVAPDGRDALRLRTGLGSPGRDEGTATAPGSLGSAVGDRAVMLARLTADTSILYLVVPTVIFGVGCGLVNAPISTTAMSGMPLDQAGVAGPSRRRVARWARPRRRRDRFDCGARYGATFVGPAPPRGSSSPGAGRRSVSWAWSPPVRGHEQRRRATATVLRGEPRRWHDE